MDRNEFIAKLQMVYVGDRNAFDEIVGVYDDLKEENQRLKEQIRKYKDLGFEHLCKENQRLNNVLNELEGDLCAIYNSFETTNNDILKKHLKKDIYLCRFKELKESDK